MSVVQSPLTGRVISIAVEPGVSVEAGTELMVLESMKMEIPVEAETAGVVARVLVAVGGEVEEGEAVVELA